MKNIYKFISTVLLFILYLTYDYIALFIIKKLNIDINTFSELGKILFVSLINLSLMLIMGLVFNKTLRKDAKDLKYNFKDYISLGLKVWIVSIIIMITSNKIIYNYYPMQAANETIVQNTIKSFPLYMIFSSVIYAPFVEELLFRKAIRNIIPYNVLYIIVSGLAFGYIHTLANVNNTMELLYIIPYGVVGAAFAYIYTKTDNIYVSMIMHAIHNLIVVIFSILTYMNL